MSRNGWAIWSVDVLLDRTQANDEDIRLSKELLTMTACAMLDFGDNKPHVKERYEDNKSHNPVLINLSVSTFMVLHPTYICRYGMR